MAYGMLIDRKKQKNRKKRLTAIEDLSKPLSTNTFVEGE
jgi:hypothetical protein